MLLIYIRSENNQSLQFKIDSANDGEEAIDIMKKYYNNKFCCKSYRIIFMEIEMPGKNRCEKALEIKIFYQSLPMRLNSKIIACSAHIQEETPGKHKAFGWKNLSRKR